MNDEGRMINKIRLIPKGKASTVFTGHIYIVEDLWCLSDADLYISKSGTWVVFNVLIIS